MNHDKAMKYLDVAKAWAAFSKDTSTKVGAIIIGPDGEQRSQGYNGAPRGCTADQDQRGLDRPEKYYWFSHAELNAITNSARVGIPLNGCTMVVTHFPCMDCARAIVQSGIKTVATVLPDREFSARWEEHILRAEMLFAETDVQLIILNSNID